MFCSVFAGRVAWEHRPKPRSLVKNLVREPSGIHGQIGRIGRIWSHGVQLETPLPRAPKSQDYVSFNKLPQITYFLLTPDQTLLVAYYLICGVLIVALVRMLWGLSEVRKE